MAKSLVKIRALMSKVIGEHRAEIGEAFLHAVTNKKTVIQALQPYAQMLGELKGEGSGGAPAAIFLEGGIRMGVLRAAAEAQAAEVIDLKPVNGDVPRIDRGRG